MYENGQYDIKPNQSKPNIKKLKSIHTTKCYMHEPEPVWKNEMHKILLDFEIKTDPLNRWQEIKPRDY